MRGGSGRQPAHRQNAPPGRARRQDAPPGSGRRQAFGVVCGLLSAAVLLLAVAAWGLTGYANSAVGRVDAGTAGGTGNGPINVLVAGIDPRTGLTRAQERKLHVGHDLSENADTLMLVHIPAGRSSVTVISLPRDSWVVIPGHGMNKINAAFGLGGPRLLVATVEHATGLTINDYAEVGFLGFVQAIDALGGVDIRLPRPVRDPDSGLRLPAGLHHVNGITALDYARDRHSFAGSDLARISHQHSLLRSLLGEALSVRTLTDPVRLVVLARSLLGAIRVDRGMDVAALAGQLRGVSPGRVRFLTVPLARINYQTSTGQSAVLWDSAAAKRLFARIEAGLPPPASR